MVLFPKGARFLNTRTSSYSLAQLLTQLPPPTAATDVPGPGAYDVPIALPDPAYKKGAMLEKAGRFAETMEGEGPGELLFASFEGGADAVEQGLECQRWRTRRTSVCGHLVLLV